MKRNILLSLILVMTFFGSNVWTTALPDYYSRYNFLMAPPGAFQDGLVGFVNPANLAFLKTAESRFFWSTNGTDASSLHNWGSFTGVPGLGFGVQSQKFGDIRVTDYKISTGFGTGAFASGLAYGWSSGGNGAMGREKIISLGGIARPGKYLSLGLIGNFSLKSSAREGVAEFGFRPTGTSLLTLFADGAWQKGIDISDAPWSVGAAVEPVSGISLVGRYFKSKTFTISLAINFGHAEIGAQGHYDSDQNISHYTYSLRTGGLQPSVFSNMGQRNRNYLAVNMKGTVDYQRYVWFDNETLRFMDILQNIGAAANDPRIGAIALNLSGMRILPEHAWEIRRELAAARDSGKKVIIFIDNAGMTSYHLASVADKVVMDPEGSIMLSGYALGKTYFKGTLAKLGLGFDEWRFFKYKSAVEVLSRDRMSDPDREQYQNYLDDWYEEVRADICASRTMTPEQYDELINEKPYFMADAALEAHLVDTLARWSDLRKMVSSVTGLNMNEMAASELYDIALPPQSWGARPKVAVVYGLGECAMDTGIKARWLERVFLSLARNKSVKAVVFRVDSPGGDGLASDLVAEALKKCAENKPVIISQGQVAGSGGYWISMYGRSIVAAPLTVTGSIGVIGGWLYDLGFSNKLGMTSDFVKRGDHADLGFGITVPFLGLQVPARNLTPEERTQMEEFIRKYYDIFVQKVAAGRKMSVEDVKRIGEGHFYSGTEGKAIGLVDEIGGLMTALALAETTAGLKPADVEILEIPKDKGLFRFRSPMASVTTEMNAEPFYRYIRMLAEHQGKPLPMLLPGTYPTIK